MMPCEQTDAHYDRGKVMRRPLLFLLLGCFACSGEALPSGSPSKAWSVGPAGGKFELPSGGQLVVPEGAVLTQTDLSVTAVAGLSTPGFEPVGPFYRFGPPGLAFQKPVTVILPYMSGERTRLGVAWSLDGSTWERLSVDVDETSKTLTAQVSHFSYAGAGEWPEHPCVRASDCGEPKGPCLAWECFEGECRSGFAKAGTSCSDGNACTVGDACDGLGECRSGNTKACLTPPDPAGCYIQEGVCDPGTGQCTYDLALECAKASDCSGGATCANCRCIAPPCKQSSDCDDGNPCTDDFCDVGKGCRHEYNSAPCDDGDVCTVGDTCVKGTCVSNGLKCDDHDACTQDACDGSGKCSYLALDCDDHDPCTKDWCDKTVGCVHDGGKFEHSYQPGEGVAITAVPGGGFGFIRRNSPSNPKGFSLVVLAQSGVLAFEKVFQPDPGAEWVANDLAALASGFLVAGARNGPAKASSLLRLDGAGQVTWEKALPDVAELSSIALLKDGKVALAGLGTSNPARLWLAVVSEAGDLLWSSSTERVPVRPPVVAARSDGGAIALVTFANGGSLDCELSFLGAQGGISSAAPLGQPSRDETCVGGMGLADGGAMVAGALLTDTFVWKVSASGVITSERLYTGQNGRKAASMAAMPDGGFVLTGQGYDSEKWVGGYQLWLLRADASGTPVFERQFGGDYVEAGLDVVGLSDGGVAAVGLTKTPSKGKTSDAYVVRTDALGSTTCDMQ